MPAPTRPPGDPRNYDRWTFDRWAAVRAGRRHGGWGGRVGRPLACAGVALLCALGWIVKRHAAHPVPSAAGISRAGPGALAGVVVVLDPGHGGEDPGASLTWGRGRVQEAALTYRTALEVARALRAQGADVRYTVRSRMLADDWDRVEPTPTLPLDAVLVSTARPLKARVGRSPRLLWQRAALAREVWDGVARRDPQAGRDVFFLSLHYDDFHNPTVRGGLVCVDRRAGPPPAFGLALARRLTARGWGRPDIADGQAGLAAVELGVLNPRYNPVPQKALLELATLSNMDDYLCATDPAWRAQMAQAVTQAVTEVHEGGRGL